MKRKLYYVAGLIFMVSSFNSCGLIENCKICQQNTYNSSNVLISAGSETKYCDAELVTIQATKDVTISGITTKWVCR